MIRKIRNWVLTAAFVLGGTTIAMAQAKIAHIDSQKLLKEMPEMKSAQAQLQKLEQSYTNDIQASVKEYQKKSQALIEPIMEKAKKAVQKVAKTQGYQYVLDSAAGAGVIVSDGKDLFNDVKKELGF